MLWKASASFYIETDRPLHRPSRPVLTTESAWAGYCKRPSTEEEARRNEPPSTTAGPRDADPSELSAPSVGAAPGVWGPLQGCGANGRPCKAQAPKARAPAILGPEGSGSQTSPRGGENPGQERPKPGETEEQRRPGGRDPLGGDTPGETSAEERPPGEETKGEGRPQGRRDPGGDPPTPGAEA